MLRSDSPLFAGFGEVYFSEVLGGQIKAWKQHLRQTQFFAVPAGQLLLVLYDQRKASSTFGQVSEVRLGRPDHYNLLKIPTGIWYGFAALHGSPALLCNCADLPHDPTESLRRESDSPDIPYCWNKADLH